MTVVKDGAFAVTLAVPAEASGECHVRVFVQGEKNSPSVPRTSRSRRPSHEKSDEAAIAIRPHRLLTRGVRPE